MYGDYFLIIHSSKCCIAYIIWIFKLFARFSLTHLQCHIWIYFLLSLPFHCRTHFSVLFVRSSCSRFLHWLAFKFSNFQIVIVTYFTWNVFDFKPKNVSHHQYRNKEARRERKRTKETWNLNGNRLLHSFNADFIQWKRNKKREKHVDALAHEHPFYFPYYEISYETILIFWCKSGILIRGKGSTTPKFTFRS